MLLLASNSPRRRRLLKEAGFRFRTATPAISEKSGLPLTLRELTAWNAIRKGVAISRTHRDMVVLAADTLIALEGAIIGKPRDLRHARSILRRLSGRTHEVCSSVFICHAARHHWALFTERSRVRFRRLSEPDIKRYLDKINPLDKAGAYAAQQSGSEVISSVTGSSTNVIGLPMERTIAALREFGIRPARRSRSTRRR
jgi:septum formation protein